jgi:hypothetical protein
MIVETTAVGELRDGCQGSLQEKRGKRENAAIPTVVRSAVSRYMTVS